MRKFVLLGILIFTACTPQDPWSRTRTEIRQIFELPLVEMNFRQVIYHSRDREWWNILESKKEALFAVPVRVQAGFNLQSGFTILPSDNQHTVEIIFPPPSVLLADALDEKLQQYFSLPPTGSVTPQELQSLLSPAVKSATEEALEAGILETASTNAQNFLTSFFGVLGFQTVIFRIQEIKI